MTVGGGSTLVEAKLVDMICDVDAQVDPTEKSSVPNAMPLTMALPLLATKVILRDTVKWH